MKKTFLFMIAALVVASFTFSSCEPNNTPQGGETTEDPGTETPGVDDPSAQSQWEQLNADIKDFFQTTENVPEPETEYEVVTTQKQAGNATWVSGMYIVTFKGNALANYATTLEAAGYVKGSVTSDGVTYPTYYTTFTSGKRTYGLTLTLFTYWNSIQEWGQFQVHISVGAAK